MNIHAGSENAHALCRIRICGAKYSLARSQLALAFKYVRSLRSRKNVCTSLARVRALALPALWISGLPLNDMQNLAQSDLTYARSSKIQSK